MRAPADVLEKTRWQHDVVCQVIAASDDMCRHGCRQSPSTDSAARAAAARAAIVVERLEAVGCSQIAGEARGTRWARPALLGNRLVKCTNLQKIHHPPKRKNYFGVYFIKEL